MACRTSGAVGRRHVMEWTRSGYGEGPSPGPMLPAEPIGDPAGHCVMGIRVSFSGPCSDRSVDDVRSVLEAEGTIMSCQLEDCGGAVRTAHFLVETRVPLQEAARLVLEVEGVEQVDIEPLSENRPLPGPLASPVPSGPVPEELTMGAAYEVLQELVAELDRSNGERSNLILAGSQLPLDGAGPIDLAVVLFHLFQHASVGDKGTDDACEARGVAMTARRSATRSVIEVSCIEPSRAIPLDQRSYHLALAGRLAQAHGWSISFPDGSSRKGRLSLRLGPGPRVITIMAAMNSGLIFAVPVKDVEWVIRVPTGSLREMKVAYQGTSIPLLLLSPPTEPLDPSSPGLVLNKGGRRACLMVNGVLGPREFVPEPDLEKTTVHPFQCRGMLDCHIKAPLLDTVGLLRDLE